MGTAGVAERLSCLRGWRVLAVWYVLPPRLSQGSRLTVFPCCVASGRAPQHRPLHGSGTVQTCPSTPIPVPGRIWSLLGAHRIVRLRAGGGCTDPPGTASSRDAARNGGEHLLSESPRCFEWIRAMALRPVTPHGLLAGGIDAAPGRDYLAAGVLESRRWERLRVPLSSRRRGHDPGCLGE